MAPSPEAIVASFVASSCCIVLLLIIGIYAAQLNGKYSPVYQEIDCGDEVITIGDLTLSGLTVSAELDILLTCTNPNPYDLQILDPKQGKIYLASTMQVLGDISAKAGVITQGTGQVTLLGSVKLEGLSAAAVIASILAGPVHVFVDIRFTCKVEESLLVTNFAITPEFDQKCGVSIDIQGEQAGGVSCADNFQDLVISDIGIETKPGAASMGVATETLEDATDSKNLYLGMSISIAFSMVALLLSCQACAVYVFCIRQRYSQPVTVNPKLTAATVGASDP
jgi:hypothetical protein